MQQDSPTPAFAAQIFEQAIGHFVAGRTADAEPLCRAVLAAEPRNPHALHMLGLIRAGAGDPDEGLALLEQALATGVQHPAIELAYGQLLLTVHRVAEAVQPLQRSAALDPKPPTLALLAKTLTDLGRAVEARDCLDRALRRAPNDADLLTASGMVYKVQGHYAEAERDLRRALELDPGSSEPYANLAIFLEHSNRLDEVAQLMQEAERRGLTNGGLQIIAAHLLRRDGRIGEARKMLEELQQGGDLLPAQRRDLEYQLAWCADAENDVPAAMAHFQAANERAMEVAAPPPDAHTGYLQQIAGLRHAYAGVQEVSATEPVAHPPAFLIGFPRSGTTLLDTMLGAHPDLWVMEEKPAIQAMLDTHLSWGLRYGDDIETLTPDQCAELRRVHARICRSWGWDSARRVVDKSPFGTTHVGFLNRVFPGTPLIFMVRHPCDVVLSCFMSSFEIHAGTLHFTRLDSTVSLYCGIMDLWKLYCEKLPLRYHQLRYEDLLAAPEAEMRKLLEFAGVPWTPEVLENAEAARRRGFISTPSYNQVSRPLYRASQDRWRRYAAYLEPYLPRLMPYIEAFGYEA